VLVVLFEKAKPIWRHLNIKLSTSLAGWAIPADENGRPRRHYGRWSEVLRILSCQTTGGQRFEHLAAKRDWHVPQKRRLESRLAQEWPPYPTALRETLNLEKYLRGK